MSLRIKYLFLSLLSLGLFFAVYFLIQEEPLRFSAPSGFYDSGFELTIQGCKNLQIYYTLDGSTPTTSSIPYTGPIRISDATQKDNVYANRTDLSPGFTSEIYLELSSGADLQSYRAPDYKLDKCTVIRAAAFDGEQQMDSISASYFVGFEDRDSVKNVRVASIITDPDNLFDHNTGIYVNGAEMENYFQSLTPDSPETGWDGWPANYRLQGKASERPVYVEVFETDRTSILSENAGMRIMGDYSRALLPRSLSLYSRTEYSGSEYFQPEELLGEGVNPHKFVLYSGGQDNLFKINDYLVHNLVSDLNFATLDFYPCVLFLNGEFWGTYHITENYNRKYVQDHYGVPESNVVLWKDGEIVEGEPYELALYEDMKEFIAYDDMTVDANYQKAQELIDLDSFIDYFASQIYIGRHFDWPGANIAAWRSRSIRPGSEYQDGRWRWMLFDLNSSTLTMAQLRSDTLARIIEDEPMLASLCKNSDFCSRFSQRLYDIAYAVYAPERTNALIDDYLETYTPVLNAGNKRFYGIEHTDLLLTKADDLRTFFAERQQYVDGMIANNLGEEFVR